jgi:UrcA family protein
MSLLNRKCGTLFGLALCAVAVSAGNASADTQALPLPEIRIRYSPAALQDPQEAKKLYARIRAAARRVCGTPDIHELKLVAYYRKCYERAVDVAVTNVHATELTSIHESHTQHMAGG